MREVLHGVTFDVFPGETVAIVGESGSGKSTTATAIVDLLPGTGKVTGGSITLEGRPLTGLSRRDIEAVRGRDIGFVPQDPSHSLNPLMRIGEQIAETLRRHRGMSRADAAARVGIRLDPAFSNRHTLPSRQYHGVAVTYAQVAVKPSVHQNLILSARVLVILDEVHHGGDALSWGDALREAYGRATRRLLLSGTPFRSDTAPIPFVEYHPDAKGIRVSRTDYTYGYQRALEDGVVRPVLFMVYAGHMRWRTKTGDEMEAHLGQDNTKDITSQAWRTALDPNGEWIPAVLRSADRRLTEVRQTVPDAGGLVIATDQTAARAYAEILKQITGQAPTVV
ncbi:MAG: ATP-binding cassette domain-containing protein, partial [Microbacterium sp.]|nr:ATP-binding cassette domain-containing protein [Microbacterium sp.]